MTFTTKYNIDEKVLIPDLENAKSTILAITIDHQGVSYRVAWFHNGKRETDWLSESELIKA